MDANVNAMSSLRSDITSELSAKADKNLESTDSSDFLKALGQAQKAPEKSEKMEKTESKVATKAQPMKGQPKQHLKTQSSPVEDSPVVQAPQGRQVRAAVSKVESPTVPSKALNDEGFDDKTGVMAQSFDGMVASYPVSRIAKESLDDDTVSKLKDDGLWNLPAYVMAQPSQQFMMMDKAAQMGALSQQEALPVARPVAQFMASLENELGVSPDRLVQAFEKLPEGQLALPPQETMSQVIKNLELNSKDEAKAVQLFNKMLTQMEEVKEGDLKPYLAAVAGAGGGVEASELGKASVKTDQANLVKEKARVVTNRYNQAAPEKAVVTSDEKGEVKQQLLTPRHDVKTPAAANSAHAEDAVFEKPQDLKGQVQNLKNENPIPVTPQAQNVVTDPNLPQMTVAQTPMAATAVSNQAESKPTMTKSFKDTKESLTVKGTETPAAQAQALNPNDLSVAKTDLQGGAIAGSSVAAQELKAGQDNKQEAIRSIVNQAQMLAQKGGGEIRMSLKPDHLGEIQLKVAMEGNKVNVQMVAERGEVKKLIEQNVHELRHGLASHNLSMDKLDVSLNQKDMGGFSKGQPDFMTAQRDFTSSQQQQNKREMLDEISSLRGNAVRSIAPDRTALAHKAFSGVNSSGRLSVMA